MTQSEAAYSLLHMHGLDGAHPLLLAVVLGDFCLDAELKKALFLVALPADGDAAVEGNLVVQERDFSDVIEQELPLVPRVGAFCEARPSAGAIPHNGRVDFAPLAPTR
jgi:hypothetical protein